MLAAVHPEAPATAPVAARSVSIIDAAVVPNALVAPPGARVVWTNAGTKRHTATADDGRFDSGALLPGQAFSISAPSEPGVYAYHCRFHSFIRGTLTISLIALDVPAPVAVGAPARLRGTVPGAAVGTAVAVERRVPGAWEAVATATTDAQGAFTAVSPPLATRTAFRAVVAGSVSPSVRAEVRPSLSVVRTGRRLRVRVSPAPPGGSALLQGLHLDSYRWHALARRPLGAGRVAFDLPAPGVYRVTASPRGGLSEVTSSPIQYRPWRFHR
jgi:plastocyanin